MVRGQARCRPPPRCTACIEDLPDLGVVIAAAIPLIMTVDWIIARARSGVNVMSDMLVAILLDAGLKQSAAEPSTVRYQPETVVQQSESPLS